jgi:hypothetical protein
LITNTWPRFGGASFPLDRLTLSAYLTAEYCRGSPLGKQKRNKVAPNRLVRMRPEVVKSPSWHPPWRCRYEGGAMSSDKILALIDIFGSIAVVIGVGTAVTRFATSPSRPRPDIAPTRQSPPSPRAE